MINFPIKYKRYEDLNYLKPIKDFLNTGILNIDGVILAGGALQTTADPSVKIKDYDVFFTDHYLPIVVKSKLLRQGFKEEVCVFESEKLMNLVKGSMNIQLITGRIYKDVEEVVDSFDIVASMYGLSTNEFVKHSKADEDVLNREIHIHKLTYPKVTWERVNRYISNKGYTASKEVIEFIRDEISYIGDENEESFFYEDDGIITALDALRSLKS